MGIRRHQRRLFHGVVSLTWTDERGSISSMRGTCRDICENGICLEIPNAIPVGTCVGLSVEPLGLKGSASVRHRARGIAAFTLGLELSQPAPVRVLADLPVIERTIH
jgi:hypothetical protein